MTKLFKYSIWKNRINDSNIFEAKLPIKSMDSKMLDDKLFNAIKAKSSLNKKENIIELVNAGANINKEDKHGWTPLMYAVRFYSSDIVKLLVELGADLDIQNNGGYSALMLAANFNFLDKVNILIKAGANLNLSDDVKDTALLVACYWHKIGYELTDKSKIVESLIKAGADITVLNYNTETFIDVLTYEQIGEEWLELEETQRMLLNNANNNSRFIIENLNKNNIKIHPNIQKEFAHIISGVDLNLL